MGKTKIKTIDDSQIEEPKKAPKKSNFAKATSDKEDSLVTKLNAELGITAEPTKSETDSVITSADRDSADFQSKAILKIKESNQAKPIPPAKRGKQSEKRSKKYLAVSRDLDRSQTYPLETAIDMVKKLSYAKFNDQSSGSLEAHINTAQTGVRGMISLPFARGTKLSILAFGSNLGLNKLTSEGVIFGDDSTIEKITQGKADFDLIITTPDWMSKLAKVAKVLGPKGLMPNLKNGTITNDVEKAIESFQSGKTEFKTEAKAPVIHLSLGKLNQPSEELLANVKILLSSIGKSKIKKVSLTPTMGPSVKLDLSSI